MRNSGETVTVLSVCVCVCVCVCVWRLSLNFSIMIWVWFSCNQYKCYQYIISTLHLKSYISFYIIWVQKPVLRNIFECKILPLNYSSFYFFILLIWISLVKDLKCFCGFYLVVDVMEFANNISLEKQVTSYQLQNKKFQKFSCS